MKETIIAKLAQCFYKKNNPVVIFCNWKDATNIKLDFEKKMNATNTHAFFKNEPRHPYLNYFSCFCHGTEFIFCDQNQMTEILTLLNSK